MARIFTALTAPADSSSAFLREAGAGAETFMDLQRQQEADERAEAEERRAVEGHQLDMEAGRISIAARETIAAQAKLQNDAAAIQASAVAGEMSTLVKDGQKLVDGGYIDPAITAQMQALNEAREGALLRGEDVRAHDMAIEAMSQDFQAKVVAGRGEFKVDGLRSRIGQLQAETGVELKPQEEEALENMSEGELEVTLNNLLRAQHEMKQIEASKEAYRGLALGWNAVGAEAEGARGLFIASVIDNVLPLGIDTAAEAQQYYAQKAAQLSVDMLPADALLQLEEHGFTGWQDESGGRLTDLTKERSTQSAGLAEWMAANPMPQSQPGVISAADQEQDDELRKILNAGPGGGVGAGGDGGELPEKKYVGEDEDEEPMDRSLPGEAIAKSGDDEAEPDAPTSISRRPSMMTSLGRGSVGRPVVNLGKLLGDVGSEVGEIAQGTAEILWDAPFEMAEGGAETIAQVMEDILVAAEPGAAKQEMTPETEKAVQKELVKVLEAVQAGLGSLPEGAKNRQRLKDASSLSKGKRVTVLSRVRSVMGALSALAEEDREEYGPISAWVDGLFVGDASVKKDRAERKAALESSGREEWPTGKLSRRPGSRFQGGRETWEPPVEGPAMGTPSPGAPGPGSPRPARVNETVAQARPEPELPPEHPSHGQGPGAPPAVDDGGEVLMAGGEMLEGVRAVVKDPEAYGLSKKDRSVLKRLGALESLLSRAVEEQDAKRVESLMGQVEKLIEKVSRGSQK